MKINRKKSEVMICSKDPESINIKMDDDALKHCFSTAGPRPGTGPWHQLYRAARGFPGNCHFSFLSIFHE